MDYSWDIEKNERLFNERGITFEEIVFHIENDGLLAVIPGKGKFGHQKQFIVNVNNYAHIVPFIEETDKIFLKTIIPSRVMTKKYLREV